MSESKIQAEVMRAIGSLPNIRIFRNQVGVGFVGKVLMEDRKNQTVTLERAYRVSMGLLPGSGDLIGWRKRIITPDDVGKAFSQFLSIEVKTAQGDPSPAQTVWMKNVNDWGGIAIIARSPQSAFQFLKP